MVDHRHERVLHGMKMGFRSEEVEVGVDTFQLNDYDDDYTGTGTPLNDVTRSIAIVVHYLTFAVVTLAMWAFMSKYSIFQKRIYSPFLLMVTLTWLMNAAAFEISNHFYVDNWQLYDPRSDLINGSFSFFNFGAQNLLALSLRKVGLGFVRKGESPLEWIAICLDVVMILLIFANPIVYAVAGREVSVTALSPLALIAGTFTLFRLKNNLGPNKYTLFGGVGFFVFVICGVLMLAVYNATEAEWVHILIGGSFISSVLPLSVAFYHAQLPDEESQPVEESKEMDEETN